MADSVNARRVHQPISCPRVAPGCPCSACRVCQAPNREHSCPPWQPRETPMDGAGAAAAPALIMVPAKRQDLGGDGPQTSADGRRSAQSPASARAVHHPLLISPASFLPSSDASRAPIPFPAPLAHPAPSDPGLLRHSRQVRLIPTALLRTRSPPFPVRPENTSARNLSSAPLVNMYSSAVSICRFPHPCVLTSSRFHTPTHPSPYLLSAHAPSTTTVATARLPRATSSWCIGNDIRIARA